VHLQQARDHTRGRRLTIVFVVGDQQTDFEEGRGGVAQQLDPLARREFALRMLPLDLVGAAAETDALFEPAQLFVRARAALRSAF
jgi:hypothetical protein